jgi:hypothetical protein
MAKVPKSPKKSRALRGQEDVLGRQAEDFWVRDLSRPRAYGAPMAFGMSLG